MADPVLTTPPDAPQPTDSKSVFNTKAFAFFGWFDVFIAEMNAMIAWISGRATAADSAATSAATAATSAGQSATAAAASAAAASTSEGNALTYAQAAGASAGIPPPVAGDKVLGLDEGVVAWVDVPNDTSKLDAVGGLSTAIGSTYLDKGTIAAAGTVAIDQKAATVQRIQAAGNLTITISGWDTDGRSEDLELHCVNFGGKTVTWPAGFWIRPDGSDAAAVGNSGVTWQTAGTDRVIVMRDAGVVRYKVMR